MTFPFPKRVLERLDRYVRIPSPSNPDSTESPSTPEQLAFGKRLVADLVELGLDDVAQDEHGIVTATLPATTRDDAPTIGLIVHMDTFPGVPGDGVVPKVHRKYDGGDIVIDEERGLVLRPQENPGLRACVGHDIVTASGNTLLGADNKAGIAIVLTAAEYLLQNPEIPHGKVRIAVTVDEEIGRGVNHFDVPGFGADEAYTIDGDIIGSVEDETFCADSVRIEVEGRSTHTGTAKNVLVNAVRIASEIITSWPEWKQPETTEGREPFVFFERMEGNVQRVVAHGLVRDFTERGLNALEAHLEAIAAEKRAKYPGAKIAVVFKEQYRNMKQVLDEHPGVVDRLLDAIREEGIEPIRKPIRGGTDGARLSFLGLPTPNMFVGGANFHGPEEWVSVQGMEMGAKVLVRLLRTDRG